MYIFDVLELMFKKERENMNHINCTVSQIIRAVQKTRNMSSLLGSLLGDSLLDGLLDGLLSDNLLGNLLGWLLGDSLLGGDLLHNLLNLWCDLLHN